MEKITRTELAWLVGVLGEVERTSRNMAELSQATQRERAFLTLRADNLSSLAERLSKAAHNRDKRIEVV